MSKLVYFCAVTNLATLPRTNVRNILINAVYSAPSETAVKETKTMLNHAGVETTMLDSGGFQIIKAEKDNKEITSNPSMPLMRRDDAINISPLHVVKVACKLHPIIMTALDFPIRELSDRGEQEREFLSKLRFNMTWALETAALRDKYCPHIQLFIPVQCYNLDHFEIFWNSIKGIRCDGLSLPIRNLGYSELALFLLRFHKAGVRKVHLLGTSDLFMIALAAYFARHFFEWMSFDSTSWRWAAHGQKYLNPYDLSPEYIGSEVLIDETLPMVCGCPSCLNTTFTDIKNEPYTDKADLLMTHNFWVTEKLTQEMFEAVDSLANLEKYLRRRSSRANKIEELMPCLSIVDFFKNEDINVLKLLLGVAA